MVELEGKVRNHRMSRRRSSTVGDGTVVLYQRRRCLRCWFAYVGEHGDAWGGHTESVLVAVVCHVRKNATNHTLTVGFEAVHVLTTNVRTS